MHPSCQALLAFFSYSHLPTHLQEISKTFCELATAVAERGGGAEATVCLRKLLEAKDCAVRAGGGVQVVDVSDSTKPRGLE